MEKVKVAVVGCGFFGEMHTEIYADLPIVQLVGICDTSADISIKMGQKFNCKSFTDLNQMLDTVKPDILDICVPDCYHLDAAIAAIERNINIFIEKPLADTLDDCRMILKKAEGYKKKVMVGFICRFDARFLTVKQEIDKGRIGDVMYMTSRRISPVQAGLRYAPLCHITTHSGVHDFDLARWFAGSEFKKVYAKSVKGKIIDQGYDVADAVLSICEFENGIIHSHENTWSMPKKFPAYIDATFTIVGTKGSLHVDMKDSGLQIITDDDMEYPDMYYWPELMGVRQGALRTELESFVKCVTDDITPIIGLEDGYRVSQVALAIMESLDKGVEIDVANI